MPADPFPLPDPDPAATARLDRLGAAMDLFLQWRHAAPRPAAAAFLATHPDLRDLLEPMLAEALAGPPQAGLADGDAAADLDADLDADPEAPLPPGRTFGDYRIGRELGRGGMGIVYEAEQISLRRRVALKVLHPHLALAPQAVARFRREAAAAARLAHPGIVPIHEVGEHRGRHYFTMELVAGRPLHELVPQDHFGVRPDLGRAAEAAELVARVADALQHAHDHGLVHRDVKPHNILIGHDGSVRLLDFGLAKDLEPLTRAVTHDYLGTPHYSSPEQASGGRIGPAADVFALGIVLYELLARRRPFDGPDGRAVLRRIERGEYEPLASAAPGVPRDLQTICAVALEPLPAARYASAGAFAADLRRFLRIEPILAQPPGPLRRTGKWLRRHRLGVALGAALLLLVAGAPLGYALHQQRTAAAVESERAALAEAEQVAFRGIEQALALLAAQLDREPPGARQQPGVDAVVRLCEDFLRLRAAAPARRERAAQALWQLAFVQCQRGDPAAAAQSCARGLDLLGPAAADEAPGLARLRGRLLRRQLFAAQMVAPHDGEAEFARAVQHWRERAAAADAEPAEAVELAETLLVRGRALADQPARRLEAERLLDQALQLLPAERQERSAAARSLALRAEVVRGHVWLWTGRTAEALAALRAAVARLDVLPNEPVLGVEKTLALAAIGDAELRLQRAGAAEAALRAAIGAAAALLAEFPGAQPLQRALLRSRLRLAGLLLGQRQVAAAETMLREAAAALPPVPPGAGQPGWLDRALRADLDVQLANCILLRCNGKGDCGEARELLHAACGLLEELIAEHPEHIDFQVDLGGALNNLAGLANEAGDAATAQRFAERAIAAQLGALAAAPQSDRARTFLGMHHGQLAYALARQDRRDEALAAARAAGEHAPRHPATLRLAAEAVARTAAAAAADAALAAAVRDRAAADHARAAVALLRQLAALNPAEARRWLADERFAVLRGRAEAVALQQELAGR